MELALEELPWEECVAAVYVVAGTAYALVEASDDLRKAYLPCWRAVFASRDLLDGTSGVSCVAEKWEDQRNRILLHHFPPFDQMVLHPDWVCL